MDEYDLTNALDAAKVLILIAEVAEGQVYWGAKVKINGIAVQIRTFDDDTTAVAE